tara:strand:- start:306 stop:1295 length:990 start_codon:yes stop_codon:yes gene_type:complete
MKISIIIPVYNSSLTLNECLTAIFASSFKNYEVIIVSDNSLDDSIKIATKFNASIIELPKNKGPANARNVGAKVACGDILLFIDSDVIINVDSLNIVSNRFISDKVEAIQGIYSHEPTYKSPVTQFYQSYLCYYVWPIDKDYASTLVTGCFAIKRATFNKFDGFDINIKNASCEDEKFGYSLIKNGYKILILRNLQVIHRVNYNLVKFIKRRFTQDFDRIKFYLREKTYIDKFKQVNYSRVIIGIPLIGFILLNIFFSFLYENNLIWYIFILLNISYISLHLGFLKFVAHTKGFKTALMSLIIFYIDTFLMLIALSFGIFSFLVLGKKY